MLSIALFFASNAYAVISNDLYIYQDDSNEIRMLKEEIVKLKNETVELNLMIFKNHRNRCPRYDKDEALYRVSDTSKKDVSAKIGTIKEQILSKTYWRKTDNINSSTDSHGNFMNSIHYSYRVII